jgi:hypothetical protein
MVLALLVLFLVSISLALLAGSLQVRMRLVREDAEAILLSGLSDAAIEEARAGIAADKDYPGAPAHAFGGGKIESHVQPTAIDNTYKVVATATYDGHKRTVETIVVHHDTTVAVIAWHRIPG